MKTEVLRTCIVCRTKADKSKFIRIVRTPNGEYILDKTGKANGRGAYVCDNQDCINKLCKTKALNRAFKTNISDQVYKQVMDSYDK